MSDDLGFSTSLSECDFLVSFWGVSANATSIVHLCPRKPQCPHLYNGHNYKRDDADSVLSTESMSVHYARPQWLLFSKLPRNFGKIPILFSKKKKKPLREENEYFSSFSFLEEVLWGQNKYESRSWGRDVRPCVGKTLFLSSSTRPCQWERQDTGSERRFSPSVSQCFCRRQRGPTRRGSALGTAVTSAGKLSLFKPESRAECGLPGRDLLRVDSDHIPFSTDRPLLSFLSLKNNFCFFSPTKKFLPFLISNRRFQDSKKRIEHEWLGWS